MIQICWRYGSVGGYVRTWVLSPTTRKIIIIIIIIIKKHKYYIEESYKQGIKSTIFFFSMGVGFELRASHLQSRCFPA
jgi:hypothetical protein